LKVGVKIPTIKELEGLVRLSFSLLTVCWV